MSDKQPKYRIVAGKWDKEAKKWSGGEFGAIWENVWPDGGTSYSVKFKEAPPVGEYLKMIEINKSRTKSPFQEAQKIIDESRGEMKDGLDDDIPF